MIEIEINNGKKLRITQYGNTIAVETVLVAEPKDNIKIESVQKRYDITEGDLVMLLNYYDYVKRNDMQCDFINYNGENKKD